MVYGVIYAIFTGIHYAAGGNPIYPQLNYTKDPGYAVLFLLVMFFAVAPLLHVLTYFLILVRETVWKRYGCCCWSATRNVESMRTGWDVECGATNDAIELRILSEV